LRRNTPPNARTGCLGIHCTIMHECSLVLALLLIQFTKIEVCTDICTHVSDPPPFATTLLLRASPAGHLHHRCSHAAEVVLCLCMPLLCCLPIPMYSLHCILLALALRAVYQSLHTSSTPAARSHITIARCKWRCPVRYAPQLNNKHVLELDTARILIIATVNTPYTASCHLRVDPEKWYCIRRR
jgi:hypothetical protein